MPKPINPQKLTALVERLRALQERDKAIKIRNLFSSPKVMAVTTIDAAETPEVLGLTSKFPDPAMQKSIEEARSLYNSPMYQQALTPKEKFNWVPNREKAFQKMKVAQLKDGTYEVIPNDIDEFVLYTPSKTNVGTTARNNYLDEKSTPHFRMVTVSDQSSMPSYTATHEGFHVGEVGRNTPQTMTPERLPIEQTGLSQKRYDYLTMPAEERVDGLMMLKHVNGVYNPRNGAAEADEALTALEEAMKQTGYEDPSYKRFLRAHPREALVKWMQYVKGVTPLIGAGTATTIATKNND